MLIHTKKQNKKEKKTHMSKTIRRLAGYMVCSKIQIVMVFLFVLISALAGVLGTYLLKPILNEYVVPLVGTHAGSAELLPFIKILMVLAAVYLTGAASSFAYGRIMIYVTNNTLNTLRRDLFNHIQGLPIPFFDTHTHGEVMSRFTNDVDAVREAISMGITQLMASGITVLGTFIMMLILSPLLTILVIVMLVVMYFVVKVIGGKSARYFKNQQAAVGKVNGYIEEMIEGQKVVKVFGREQKVSQEFSVYNDNLRVASTNANIFANIIMPIMGNLSYVNFALTAIVGAILTIRGILDIGTLAVFLQYTRSFSQPITQISQQVNVLLAAIAGSERIFDIIDRPVETDDGYVRLVRTIEDKNNILLESEAYTGTWAWKHPHRDGNVTYTKLQGDVVFDHVTFGYEKGKTVLCDISLYARPGQKIALVGSTGAGKTTITNLLNRFYDIEIGKIRYDGINIKKIRKDDLRRSLAMVLQDTHLFTGSIEQNIAYGKLDATHDEVVAAATLANADHFIRHLPEGYDTILTSDGANLSQGQRQLLSIARAAIGNPPVLILDEATSSIDTRTEALIEKGMDRLMEGRTVFVIAHRLSTVRNADAILVLENGQVIERGNHDELMSARGKYYRLCTGQFELS